tara:strand:+ start:90 stop:449 length:360 start_codon:yes stop_codon:yes gene_type:complete
MIITLDTTIDNISLGIGDKVYYTTIDNSYDMISGFSESDYQVNTAPTFVGNVTSMTDDSITLDTNVNFPPIGSFLIFEKDVSVNKSGLKGYYAKVRLKNNSSSPIELFSISSEVAESSK